MRRRQFMIAAAGMAAAAHADLPKVTGLSDALRWLDRLERARAPAATGAWPLSAVLDHLAQGIEMSLDGYPAPQGALFQATAGRAAFAYFKWRGAMRHPLDQPIPGAPPLAGGPDWRAGARRLRAAIARFESHRGPLHPHFAYGALDRADYALAHTFHIANHQDEVRIG